MRTNVAATARALRDDAGAAAVEFALVFPLLLVMLIGIFEFGRAWNVHQVITDASREGARRAVVRDTMTKAVVVPQVIGDRLDAAGLEWDGTVEYEPNCVGWTPPIAGSADISVSGCGWGRETGEEARVVIKARYPFQFLRPLLVLLPGDGTVGPTVMSTNFIMRNE
jgi:Flp pilus assembly pilin Flp